MLNLLVGGTEYLNGKLVQGFIVTLARLQRIPRITPLDFPLHTHLLGLLAESLLLSIVLQLQQEALLLEYL